VCPPARPSEDGRRGPARKRRYLASVTRRLPAFAGSALLLAAILLQACRIEGPAEEVYFDLEVDSVLTGYGRVTVALQDSLGSPLAVLFDDSLASPGALRRLPAGPYRGGAARLVIQGYAEGRPVYRETRVYDGRTGRVSAVDIHLGPFPPSGPGEFDPVQNPPRPPVLVGFLADTVVSIRDSVELWAFAEDPDGDLRGWSMDCDGDGRFEDSAAVSGGRASILRGRRFNDSGAHRCVLVVRDRGGREARANLGVRVEWDPPTADAGEDTTVVEGTRILLHARGEDRFGPIVTREWKIGDLPFRHVPQQETTHEAPAGPGELVCILRVTDSDGLQALDTLRVTVIPRTQTP
jgi:hypothetical protein